PREEISQYAPKIAILHVEPSQIGEVIGPGGKTIRKIIEETNTAIDVDDDGTVTISGKDPDQVGKASRWINGLTRRLKIGEVFEGEVKRIKPFGVFVEIFPGREGLVHISKMAPYYVKDPRDLVKPGQKIKVKVIEIDERNRINLSMILDERRSR
ncbi:MAG: S1 RNA-binding domain-containing protein, partial [Candidatus Zixiibacteriota bacterium]